MRQVREVLGLTAAGVSGNELARRVGVAPSTVRLTLRRLAVAGLGWPLPTEMTNAALEAQLFTSVGTKQGHRRRAEPDWVALHRELKRKHVTLQILWDEYIEQYPDGYRYSRFCELYRGWASRISVTMRQTHAGGDKLFVDYAGDTVPVIIVERWLLGRLRHRRFYSLAELNAAIGEMLRQLNEERPIRRLGVTRRALLEELDRPHLKPLPSEPYSFAEWRLRRVGVDYHVEVQAHFYSVPYRFARSEVEVRLTPRTVEVFLKGERVAAHLRSTRNHRHTTIPEHMPSSHRRYADWTLERIRREAASIAPPTAALCELILERRPHPEQGFRSCLGIVRLVRPFGADRLEAAATRAIQIGTLTYGSGPTIPDRQPR